MTKNNKMSSTHCCSCIAPDTEDYLLLVTDNFKVVLDDKCQMYPGKYIIVSLEHLHPSQITFELYTEIERIKHSMEHTIRKVFGHGELETRNVRFNYCRLGNSFKEAKLEHYHEYCIPISDIPFVCQINGFEHNFTYHLLGKPFDNTVRNYPNKKVLEWIRDRIKENFKELLLDTDTEITKTVKCNCVTCSGISQEKYPLFETENYKVVLNEKNQYCPGRMFICTKYHVSVQDFRTNRTMLKEFYDLTNFVGSVILKFYDDPEGLSTRFHVCILGNVSGTIDNTHCFWHIAPRTSKGITILDKTFEDIYWGTPFNNNIKFIASDEFLNETRSRMLSIIDDLEFPFSSSTNYLESQQSKEIKCMQCKYTETDIPFELFRTSNFRIILRDNDQRVPGRSLIISLDHIHPDEFSKRIDLIVERTIIEILLHQTFVSCYPYKRAQHMRLGNLTGNPSDEHSHQHYIPSTDEEIHLKVGNEEFSIKDERWGLATNINPDEGYTLVKRSPEFLEAVKTNFRKSFIPINGIQDEILGKLSDKGHVGEIASSLVLNIVNKLNITFL
jgi:diadenosine tetraphosphate (Ap4A) HIT family hydrolase